MALALCSQVFPQWKSLDVDDVEIKDTSGLTNQTLLIRKKNSSSSSTNYFITGNPLHCDQQYPPFTRYPHTNFFIEQNRNGSNKPEQPNSPLTNVSQIHQSIKLAGQPFTNPPAFPENPSGLCLRFFNNPLTKYNLPAQHAFFQTLSDHGIGPRCYLQNNQHRIQQLIESRNATIFELRNSYFLQNAVRQICDIHNNIELGSNLRKATNGGEPFLTWESFLQKWIKPYEIVKNKIQRSLSSRSAYKDAVRAFEFILKPGFQQEFESMLPENAKLVPSHNDIQQCNLLIHKSDLRRMTIIDYDYVHYNYRSFDIAAYINECELDNNSGDEFPFIAWYPQNRMTIEEEKKLIQIYIRREWEIKKSRNEHEYSLRLKQKIEELKGKRQAADPNWQPPVNWNPWDDHFVNKDNIEQMPKVYDKVESFEDYLEKQFETLWEEVQQMKTLQHLYWGVWSLATAPLDKLDTPLFNFHYALGRLDRYKQLRKKN